VALQRRLRELLFRRITPGGAEYNALIERVRGDAREELERRRRDRAESQPAAILRPVDQAGGWLPLIDFWLLDERMPSALGALPENKVDRIIDWARWTGVLLPSFELSEAGYILQRLLLDAAGTSGPAPFNLIYAQARPCLPALYIRLMLSAEILFPFLANELVERHDAGALLATRGDEGLLRAASDRLLARIGQPSGPEEILAIRGVREFRKSIERKDSTAENYLRPRLEFLVDMALLGRKDAPQGEFPWVVLPATHGLAAEWRELTTQADVAAYLDERFFSSLNRIFHGEKRRIVAQEEVLLWFGRAVQWIGREIGFTPGHAGALLACLLAWEAGAVLEIAYVYRAVYEAAHNEWGRFLHFSGGSRLDREFLVRIDGQLVEELERRLGSTR
jgi:hypothetical protein